jgi:hypothetical protein
MGVQLGLSDTVLANKGKSTALLNDLVYKKLALGWSDAQLKDYMGNRVTLHDGLMYGDAGETFDKLHALAYANGVTWASSSYLGNVRAIMTGRSTMEAMEAKIRQQAAAKYTALPIRSRRARTPWIWPPRTSIRSRSSWSCPRRTWT